MDAPDTPDYRLGAQPPRHDPRTLKLATYLTADLPPPPPSANWLSRVADWPMYLNDRIGCCTCTSAADMILAWTTNAGTPSPVGDDDVLTAYEAVSGYRPDDPSTDRGAVELDVLNYWRRVGIGGHRPTAYVKVDHTDHRQVRQAIALFGGIYIGIALPLSARGQVHGRGPWRPVFGPQGRKWSWGGHAVAALGYSHRGLTCVTWGGIQTMTWGFWRRYVVESYGLVSIDALDAAGRDPQGLDLPHLLDDLAAISAG